MKTDYLIVGSGLTGACIARMLKDAGLNVVVLERRPHLAGNCHDQVHASGIRFHTYGPHLFRTSSEKLWNWVQRFSDFYPYHHRVSSLVEGAHEQWPVTHEYMERTLGPEWKVENNLSPENFEEACLAKMPRPIYEKFVKEYTQKQWGKRADQLEAKLSGRLEVRTDNDPRFLKPKFQGLPTKGYTHFISNILSGIPIVLNCDYLKERSVFESRKLIIFTGAIDEFYSFDLGRLEYRAQSRSTKYLPDVERALHTPVVNNPAFDTGAHIRSIEWKQFMQSQHAQNIKGTLLTHETPVDAKNVDSFEYPFPDSGNRSLYKQYQERAAQDSNILFCGRLGEYRYLDMDQAIGRALTISQQILRSAGVVRAAEQIEQTAKEVLFLSTSASDSTAQTQDLIGS